MAAYFEDTGSGALQGAATGAAIGSLFPGPGTAIGAGGGAVLGGLLGWGRGRSADKNKQRIEEARKRLAASAQASYAQRQADMQRGLGYFAPVDDFIARRYGPPQGGGGGGMP